MYGEHGFVPYSGFRSSGCSEAAPSLLRPPHQSCDNCLLLRLQSLQMRVLVVALVASTTGISHVVDDQWEEERELAQEEEECRQEEVSPCQQVVETVPWAGGEVGP